jgi:hypothetical protein
MLGISLFLALSSGQRHFCVRRALALCTSLPGSPGVHVLVLEAEPVLDEKLAVGHVPQTDVADAVTVEVTGGRLADGRSLPPTGGPQSFSSLIGVWSG